MWRKIFAGVKGTIVVGAGIGVGWRFGIPAGVAAGYCAFLWVALIAHWPSPSWLAIDAVEEALDMRSKTKVRLTNACNRTRYTPAGTLELWELDVAAVSETSEIREFMAAKFQLAEAKAALDDVQSSILRSMFVTLLTVFVTIAFSVVSRGSMSDGGARLKSASECSQLETIVSVTAGIASPLAQVMFLLGCCLFVYKRNIAYRPTTARDTNAIRRSAA